MKMRLILFLSSILAIAAAAEPGMVHYAGEGFSIRTLEEGAQETTYQLLHMFLPQRNGFAPNVNIQKQAWGGDLDDYKALSDSQFTEYGLEVRISEVRDDSCLFEYTGVMQGFDLHFYSRALLRGGYIYIATATVPVADWEVLGPQAVAVVASFSLD